MRAPRSGVYRAKDMDCFKGERSGLAMIPPKGWKG